MATPVSRAFREILKSARTTFRSDVEMVKNSRRYAHEKFLENKAVTDPKEVERLLTVANATAHILLKNVVQGVKTEKKDVYKLNIDENKEVNDNATAKINSQKYIEEKNAKREARRNGKAAAAAAPAGGCCGGNCH